MQDGYLPAIHTVQKGRLLNLLHAIFIHIMILYKYRPAILRDSFSLNFGN